MATNPIKFRLLRQDKTNAGQCYMHGCENPVGYDVGIATENSRFSTIGRPPTIGAVNAQLNGYHRHESVTFKMDNAEGRTLGVKTCEEHHLGLLDKLNAPIEQPQPEYQLNAVA